MTAASRRDVRGAVDEVENTSPGLRPPLLLGRGEGQAGRAAGVLSD